MYLWQEYHTSGPEFLLSSVKWHVILIHPITNNFYFDHLINVVSAQLLYYKVTLLFPL